MPVEYFNDHKAFTCICGSVNFNLLLSNKIECSSCQAKLNYLWGQKIIPIELGKKKVNSFKDNVQVVSSGNRKETVVEPSIELLLSNMKILQEYMYHVSMQMVCFGDYQDIANHGIEVSNAGDMLLEWIDEIESLIDE